MEKRPLLKVCSKGWNTPEHNLRNNTHKWWELVYIVKGRCNFEVENGKYRYVLNEGSAVIVRPNTVHSSWAYENKRWLCFWLLLDYPGWDVLAERQTAKEVFVQDRLYFEILLQKLLEYVTIKAENYSIEGALYALIALLKTELNKRRSRKNSRDARNHFRIINKYQKILRIIEEEYHGKLALQNIAEKIGLSQSRTSHLFKEASGISISKHLLYYRINSAKNLLLKHIDEPIKKIAGMVGFKNLNHFYLQFRKISGNSPSRYRSVNYHGG